MTAMVWIVAASRGNAERVVLEQNDAAFFDLARSLQAGEGIDDAALAGIIDDAGGEHGAQNAMNMLVQFGRGNSCPLPRRPCTVRRKKMLPGSSLSRPAAEAFSVLCVPPQSERTKPGNCQIFLENIGEQIFVLAGEVAIDAVVRAHHRRGMALRHADLKGQQIDLARGALADGDVDGVAAALLVVERVVLDIADHMLRLRCPE